MKPITQILKGKATVQGCSGPIDVTITVDPKSKAKATILPDDISDEQLFHAIHGPDAKEIIKELARLEDRQAKNPQKSFPA